MVARNNSTQKIIVFLVITFALSANSWALMIGAGTIKASGGLYEAALMWCPAAGAIITQLVFQHSIGAIGWRPGKARYLWTGYLLPVLYGLAMYAVVWVMGLGGFSLDTFAQ